MKIVSYKDPYDKIPVVIQIEDDDTEALEEVIHFLPYTPFDRLVERMV